MRLLFKKSSKIIIIVLLLLSGLFLLTQTNKRYTGKGLWYGYKIETKQLEGKIYRLVVAENPEQWTKGLMYVRKPVNEFDGMIFRFPKKQPQLFWNQNTFENLTLYWISDGQILGKSELPSIERSKQIVTVESPAPVDTVVEIIK